jgi:predicted ArsR family transcriptional regulator
LPINIKDYYSIKERDIKTNKALLDNLEFNKEYSSTDIKEFLKINKNAVLHRLKQLESMGYLESRMDGRLYVWKKIKDMENENSY